MDSKYIALAIPVFFLLIALELAIARWQGADRYRFEDSITNLSCGVGQQILGVLFKGAVMGGYLWVYEHGRLLDVSPRSPLAWLLLLLGVDLCYYAYHLAMHRVALLWAGHAVHHQSEELNLTVALRQAWLVQFVGWIFYLPLALLGFPPLMFLAMTTLNTLYQFWIHLRGVPRLGALEWVLNTPSHHRVHHGINPRYIDKNYGGMLIIWDRLFGTFVVEDEEPVYGTVKPIASWNPLWANLEILADLWARSRRVRRPIDRLKVWFWPPGWVPELDIEEQAPPVDAATFRRYVTPRSWPIRAYVLVNFALVAAATTLFLLLEATAPAGWKILVAGQVLTSLVVWGALFEGKRWAQGLESLRLLGVAGALLLALSLGSLSPLHTALGLAATACLALWKRTVPAA